MVRFRYLVLTLSLFGLAVPLSAHAAQPNFFTQNGNNFGDIAVLGTNDNFPLVLETNNIERVRIDENEFLFTGTSIENPVSLFHIKDGAFLFDSGDDFMLRAPSTDNSINMRFMDPNNNPLVGLEYDQTSNVPGFFITLMGEINDRGLFMSALNGNVSIGSIDASPQSTLQVVSDTGNSTLTIGSSESPGCLAMGDSDGIGVTYITANDGVLTATTTKPSICD